MAKPQKGLTQREADALFAIKEYRKANKGAPPTHRELMDAIGAKSTAFVRHLLSRLEAKGKIEFRAKEARGIRVLSEAPKNKSEII